MKNIEYFFEHIEQYEHLRAEDKDLLRNHLKCVEMNADEYLIEAGKICKQVFFILEGVLRLFFYDKDGNEISRYFLSEDQFVVDLPSFTTQTPSSEYVQVVTDCRLVTFNRTSSLLFEKEIPNWLSITKKITEEALMKKISANAYLIYQDATTRYINFIEQNPHLSNRISLGHMASYLGITQSSLSRIRKQLSRKVTSPI